ncbi:hypothetical protein KFU94_67780 [Chloroflexi bacterium TSY]|nr:hypothetical protein [Chloroflexi bacterium TSY]
MALYDLRNSKILRSAWTTVRETKSIGDVLAAKNSLTLQEKHQIIDQALLLITQLYANLPVKKARHAVNIEQQLLLLRSQQVADDGDYYFHREMIEIFKGLRDAHTNYELPPPYRGQIAFLPFMIQDCFADNQHKFFVTRMLFEFHHDQFKRGVEITHWNGIPIERAVQINAEREEGSNLAARFAFGLNALTIRDLGRSLPPDEEWVVVTFQRDSQTHEIIFPWRVWDSTIGSRQAQDSTNGGTNREQAAKFSLSARVQQIHLAKKHLFAREVLEVSSRIAPVIQAVESADRKLGDVDLSGIDLSAVNMNTESILPEVLQFALHKYNDTDFGYIRIRTFEYNNLIQFVNEFLRILALMPRNGLVLDVRGNGGGLIHNGELLLQLFTPQTIKPEPAQFICSQLTMALCSRPTSGFDQEAADLLGIPLEELQAMADLRREWADSYGKSIASSLQSGSVYSKGVPITDPTMANSLGQRYHGPVVLITDAMSYSTTDIFAAGFADHQIGPTITVSGNTGAGGANVLDHATLVSLLHSEGSSIRPLPNGVAMRVALRRTLRVGSNDDQILEDIGVNEQDIFYHMTFDDLMHNNKDLIFFANEILSGLPCYQLDIDPIRMENDVLSLSTTTSNMDRLDFFLDGRPTWTTDVSDGDTVHKIPCKVVTFHLEIKGYSGHKLVASRKLQS